MALAAAVFILILRWRGGEPGISSNPALNPAEKIYLESYLSARSDQLRLPAGDGSRRINFTVSSGETADDIAENLQSAGLLIDGQLFLNYVHYHGIDSKLEAGDYILTPQLTIPEMADALTKAVPREIEIRFLEGWRAEEMAEYLATTTPAQVNADNFLGIIQRRATFDLTPYNFLASLPPEATLEGFLFPDTYRLPMNADAAYLVDLMLQTFGNRVTPAMRQAYGSSGLTLRQGVTLASIVEREAVNSEERPLIASVFFNRLAQGMRLEADPTVQFAIGKLAGSDTWWQSPLTLGDLELNSPYNTYLYTGLPPGPIANPGLSSLVAVAEPATSAYIFFVADCANGDGRHNFSVTYDEHLAYVQQCR